MAPQNLLSLSPAFTMRLPITKVQSIGITPTGNRGYICVNPGGTFTLPDGSVGAIFSEGGDWAVIADDGFAKLDVRAHAKTVDTHELLYITYTGHLEVGNPLVAEVLGATSKARTTAFNEHKIFISVNVETQAPKYAWMNRTIFVGIGRFDVTPEGSFIVYEVYKATP